MELGLIMENQKSMQRITEDISRNCIPTDEEIWQLMETISDPEIPVISIVDLGIVRAIDWGNAESNPSKNELLQPVVTITPTYSGCPAVDVIVESIKELFIVNYASPVQIKIQLSPAWSTDWLSESGREKLVKYGIAPPLKRSTNDLLPAPNLEQSMRFEIHRKPVQHACINPLPTIKVPCPLCRSADSTCISQFGSTPCKALYRCNSCLEPFDYFKCH